MIGVEELQKRIDELFKIFKRRTKGIACYLMEKDGFIIASLKDDFLDSKECNKILISLYLSIEKLAEVSDDLINFKEEREIIAVGELGAYFKGGVMIIIKSINENLTFLAVYPTLLNVRPILDEFNKAINELSIYFSEDDQKDWRQLYKVV